MEGTVAETIPAKERAAILDRDIKAALKAKQFRFQVDWYRFDSATGSACGCAIGAALHVLSPGVGHGDFARDALEATGFLTQEEVFALEEGYEYDHALDSNVSADAKHFLRLGRSLRARPDSRPVNKVYG